MNAIVPVTSQTNLIVKKSNCLIRCRWEIKSIYEMRLVASVASRIHTNDTDFQEYEIPVTEILGEGYGGHDLKELEKAALSLLHRVIQIFEPNGKDWRAYTLFCTCAYVSGKGILKMQFHPGMKPHYLNLKEKFAEYSLAEFMELPSVYSQRLFEFLKSWDDCPEVEITLDNLHIYLNTPASLRKDFRNFRRYVLDQAYKDIVQREGSTLNYEYEAIKAPGRAGKIVALRFYFHKTAARPSGVNTGAGARADRPRPSPSQSAKELEQKRRIECRDCFQSHKGHCENYNKDPSEIKGRGPKKQLCVLCLTDGPVATDKMFARMTESGELAFLGIRPKPKPKPEETQPQAES